MTARKVTIIQRRLARYRVRLFESLRKGLAEEDVLLQVVYGVPTPDDLLKGDEGLLPWGLNVPCHYLGFGNFQFVFQKIPNKNLNQQDLIILPHENRMLFNYFLLLKRQLNGMHLAFWGHGANFREIGDHSYKSRLRSWTARHVDWWFAYSSLSMEKVIEAGFPKDRITCLNNSVDTRKLMEWRGSISDDELEALRLALGLKGKKLGIFLGGLYKDKRLDFLFSASDELHRTLEDFELLIIGDGPLRDRVADYGSNRPWVHWVGAKHDREKVLHLALGHVVLNPGMVGLGILDSFAMGLPMVTTDCGIHSPEIAYLDSGSNGLMVSNNKTAFTEGVLKLLTDLSLRKTMARNCEKECERYSLDKMVDNFSEGILKALSL